MAFLYVNQQRFNIDLVVFDKDGTLVDFDHLWGAKVRSGVGALVADLDGAEHLSAAIYASLGYDPDNNRTAGGGPLAVATIAKLNAIAASVLYRHGIAWEQAEMMVEQRFAPPMVAPPQPHEIRPLGEVYLTLQRMSQAGVKIAVITSDDRAGTEAGLSILGVADFVDALVCGDDDLPNKPSPQAMRRIASQLGVQSERIMMVGDTASDMRFGRNAGVACCVGIAAGAGDITALRRTADLLVPTIDAIKPVEAFP